MSFVKKGVRYKLVRTHANRWSEGKVHLQYYDKLNRTYVDACRPRPESFGGYFSRDVEDITTPITCKKCAKKDPR